MMGWIDRVVPQPPAPHVTEETPVQQPEAVKAPTGKSSGPTDAAEQARTEETEKKVAFVVSEDSSSVFESVGSSVLSWLSYGLEKVIPQPAPGLQALGKSFETSIDIADETEVQVLGDEDNSLEITPFDPEEDVSEDEAEAGAEEWAGKRVLNWLSQGFERIVPQPEGMKKPETEPKKSEGAVEGERSDPPPWVPLRARLRAGAAAGTAPRLHARDSHCAGRGGNTGPAIPAPPLHHFCPQTAHVLVPAWVPRQEAARKAPEACPLPGLLLFPTTYVGCIAYPPSSFEQT